LIELMVAVAIIGILAGTAIPAFIKYVRKAKTSEVRQNLKRIYDGARIYYLEPRYNNVTNPQPEPPTFPHLGFWGNFGPWADEDCCAMGGDNEKCQPEPFWWDNYIFHSLHFSMDDPHYFAYGYHAWNSQEFLGEGRGNLDCDNLYSVFFIHGWAVNGEPTGNANLFRFNELE
jgi:type II secretory pathway pseudopilin PulG